MTIPIRERDWCSRCYAFTSRYVYEREGLSTLRPCIPCKLKYMSRRYAADPQRFIAAARARRAA